MRSITFQARAWVIMSIWLAKSCRTRRRLTGQRSTVAEGRGRRRLDVRGRARRGNRVSGPTLRGRKPARAGRTMDASPGIIQITSSISSGRGPRWRDDGTWVRGRPDRPVDRIWISPSAWEVYASRCYPGTAWVRHDGIRPTRRVPVRRLRQNVRLESSRRGSHPTDRPTGMTLA